MPPPMATQAQSSMTDMLLERVPPQSADAEQAVLGALLLNNDVIGDVIQFLSPDHFYQPRHALIFESILQLHDEGQRVDLLILNNHLKSRNRLQEAGDTAYLMELFESVPSAANAVHYARIVLEKAVQRLLISACSRIAADAYVGEKASDELLDAAEQEIFAIAEKKMNAEIMSVQDIFKDVVAKLDAMKDRDTRISGVATGFHELDDMIGGLKPGELAILAARPSMGKTTLALNVIDQVAVRDQRSVLFFSVEMARFQVVLNMICARAGIDSALFRKGFISSDMIAKIVTGVAAELYKGRLFIDDTAGISITQLRAKARRLKARQQIEMIVIDYLQLVEGRTGQRDQSREQEIAFISRSLKALARELDLPVLALAQLNRSVEGRADQKPMLSDLRESGAIEQDADLIMFLTREDYRNPEEAQQTPMAKLIIAKQRNGPTGVIDLVMDKKHMRFHPYSPRAEGF